MKKIVFASLIFLSGTSHVFAGDTLIGVPPGYLSYLLYYSNGIAVDPSDNVWIAYQRIGLAKYDGVSWTVYDSLNSPLLKNKILSVAVNQQGVWAGTDTGLFNLDGGLWTRFTVANSGLASDTAAYLYSNGGYELYIFSTGGFTSYDGANWQQYNTSNSNLVDDTVQCMYKGASGNLWVGTKNGLSLFDGNTWQNFTSSNSSLADDDIRSLAEDGNGQLFVGTASHGMMIYNGSEFLYAQDFVSSYHALPQTISRLHRLPDGSIYYSSRDDYFFTSNPFEVKTSGGFFACDTNYNSTVDAHGRIWRVNRRPPLSRLWMRDSLTSQPLTPPPSSYSDLDINQVRCGIWNDNTMHWDKIGTARYEVPKNSYRNSVFASSLWVGGLDTAGKLHMAAQTYRQSGDDFWPGPLDTISATLDSSTALQYDSIWKINRRTVDEFITQFNLGNVANGSYTIPSIILNWPAHGNGNYSRSMAPFTDHNADGTYNPLDGDYPDIKGDQMLWWVMNDNFGIHRESDGVALGIEIHAKAYAYNCMNIADSNAVVNFTTFYSFDIINRCDSDYHDVFAGMYLDVDLGNYLDDFVGCNVEHDMGFVYNGDNNDEGVAGYGLNPPMMSVALLDGPLAEPGDSIDNNHNGIVDEPGEHNMMNHFIYYNNNNDACLGNPNGAQDFYDYLRTINRCGNHFTYGGNGNGSGNGGTNIPCDYFFPGTPYDTGWTESSAGNLPDDRRFLMGSGPFALRKGETRTIGFAYVYSRDESAPNGLNTSIAKNLADVERVKRWFDADSFPCNNSGIGIAEPDKNGFDFSLYPNPARDQLTIRSGKVSIETVDVISVIGAVVFSRNYASFSKQRTLNTAALSRGIYFVKVTAGKTFGVKMLIID